jgi:hypothetical protein
MEASWLLALISVPLFFNPDAFRIFETNKIALFRSIVWVALTAWGIKGISLGVRPPAFSDFKHSLKQVFQIPLAFPVAALALVFLISTLFSISPLTSLQGSFNRAEGALTLLSYLFFFFLIAANLRRREQLERVVAVLAAVSFGVDLYAILQHFGLDPLIWQLEVTSRAISTIGQFIFAAAFLSMAFFVILGRAILAFQSFLAGGVSRSTHLLRVVLYGLVSVLNLVAIWYTVSRGPLIGLFFGLGLFALLLLLYWQMRRMLLGILLLGVVFSFFLVLLNLPNGPLAGLRTSPLVGPLGRLFETETGTGQTRVLIWQGMSRLTAPHEPLSFPNKSQDRWNPIRLLVGYGPDTLDLAYSGYYNPQLYALEARTIQYDRAHNEFWDVLYFYGLLGVAAEFGFFLCLFYYGFLWLGLIVTSGERKLYWGLALAGGFLGGFIPILTAAPEFIGLGFPLGLLAGLAGIFLVRVFRPAPGGQLSLAPWQMLMLISLLAAILSHYVEVLFGISIITSRLLLWTYAGLFLFVGWVVPAGMEASSAETVSAPLPGKAPRDSRPLIPSEFRQIGVNAGLVSLLMATLGAGFLSTHQVARDAGQTLANALTSMPRPEPHPSYWIFGLFMGVLLAAALFLQLEEAALAGRRPTWASLLLTLGIALPVAVLTWMIRASQLVAIAQALTRPDIAASSTGVAGLLTAVYLTLFIFALLLALALQPVGPVRPFSAKPLAIWGSGVSLAACLLLVITLNLRPMQADMLFLQAINFSKTHEDVSALDVYTQVVQLAPTQNDHLAYAENLYSAAINDVSNGVQKEQYFQTGLKYVQQAEALEPLSINNTMALARFYRLGGDFTSDSTRKNMRFYLADTYYATALGVKSGRIDYWLEWAEFRALQGDFSGALDKVKSALAVDDTYAPIYQFSGDLYFTYASSLTDPAARTDTLTKALQAYQKQTELAPAPGENAASAFFDVGKVYESLGQNQPAREAYLQAAALGAGKNQWLVYQKIAEVAANLKDPAQQREYLQKAVDAAPGAEKPALQSKLDALTP